MKKLNCVQISLRYAEPEMEVSRLGIVFPKFKASCSAKRWKERAPKVKYMFRKLFLFSVGCLTLLHSVRSYFAHVVYSVKALESRIEIVTITAKLLQHNE